MESWLIRWLKCPARKITAASLLPFLAIATSHLLACPCQAADAPAAAEFRKDIQPILAKYCYDCHGDGARKGGIAFDELKSDEALLNRDLWWKALRNVRAGLMPPEKKPRPSAEQRQQLERWIKYDVFGIDASNPDPGQVTLHRLNRAEYRNTIRDLMGFDFKTEEEFPPDDTGYGFDNIGDVLTVSPLLLEKYMQAAKTIVAGAVATTPRAAQEVTIPGAEFRGPTDATNNGDRLSFYQDATVSHTYTNAQPGDYRLTAELDVLGQFDFDPGRCRVTFTVDDRQVKQQEFGWQSTKRFHFDFDQTWKAGDHHVVFDLKPLVSIEKKTNSLDLRIVSVKVQGPLDKKHWVRVKNHERFFPRESAPPAKSERRAYAREVLTRFATKAFRRPLDAQTVDRLTHIAEGVYSQPGKKFEEGIGQAMVAVLASPRFLFRVERTLNLVAAGVPPAAPAGVSPQDSRFPFVDEYALASRLSYFLWSTMPDDDLFRLAQRGELRKNLDSQVARMLADKRADALAQNFTGQWLQVRDVEGIAIDARWVLARDNGEEKELQRQIDEFRARFLNSQSRTNRAGQGNDRPNNRPRKFNKPSVELDEPLRQAMRRETEMVFEYVLREDRSVLELLDSDYTFLNERLAKLYGIPDVKGKEMRRVSLPKDSPRGGLLTEGTVLVVTSNPTRTSPVKRGLFVLDNILGMPPAPPPPDVPLLEDSEKQFKDREPTLREVLEVHRNKPLCSSCHSRMDPLGLALENFNAMGMWREKERGQAIETTGRLITGEPFQNIREVKQILKTRHQQDFYRCLTEKLLTYALGRGLEYYDVETVDRIVQRLEQDQGRFSSLLMGVIESAPFQKRRNPVIVAAGVPPAVKPGVSPADQQESAVTDDTAR